MRTSSWVILSLVAIMMIVLILMANRLKQIKPPTSGPAPVVTGAVGDVPRAATTPATK